MRLGVQMAFYKFKKLDKPGPGQNADFLTVIRMYCLLPVGSSVKIILEPDS